MKNDELYEEISDLDLLDDYDDEPMIRKSIMTQKIDKKRKLALPEEITLRKKKINRMFNDRFGRHFINIKPESLIVFEKQFREYFFSPNSKFLHHFPRLRKKLLHDKKINYNKLSSKIDIGSLLYLSETEKKKTKKDKIEKKENILAFSKNFATHYSKDVIGTEINKVKFWDKNASRIRKLFNKRFQEIANNINDESFIDEEDDKDKNYMHSQHSQTLLNYNKNNMRSDKSKLVKFASFNKKNNENENFEDNNTNKAETIFNNNTSQIIANPPLKLNIENNNSIMKSYLNNLKYYSLNINNNKNKDLKLINDSTLPSLTLNSINNTNDIKKMHSKNSELKSFSRNHKNLKEKINNFNSKIFNKTHKNFSNNIKKELIESHLKYKRNISNQVKGLNSHTIKCNLKLFKLIDGNYTIKSTERIKKLNEFDIKKDLSDDNLKKEELNEKKSFLSFYEYAKLRLKSKENNKINNLINEINNNISSENKFKKRELKLFPKRLYKMKDDYALQMVERLYSAHKISREKAPELKDVVKEDREIKHKKKIIVLRKKTKFNHEKIIKMGVFLTMEKDKLFKKHKKNKK
jgi:hypothetical protein